ncbi:hypothetical protein K443DRAFT_111945, partial [Laccaria amethystina LaAM-08-1]
VDLAAAVRTGNCSGAPRLLYEFGRPPPVAPASDLTVPEPTSTRTIHPKIVHHPAIFLDNVIIILARFADAGFRPK